MRRLNRDIFRLLDANLNRAAEGVRVLEEAARMLRNDSVLTRELKELRHALAGIIREAGDLDARMLCARDSEGDVLREGETDSERSRPSLLAVIRANAGRAQEAMRALEEYGKLVHPELSLRFKALRFRLYDLEKKLAELCRSGMQMNACHPGVCVIINRELTGSGEVGALAWTAADAGAGMVVYRDAVSCDRDLLRNAGQAVAACEGYEIAFLMGERLDAALLAGAGGVLVGSQGMPPPRCRELAGGEFIIGVSPGSASLMTGSDEETGGADFILTGPVSGSPGSFQLLRDFVRRVGLPVVAMGPFDSGEIERVLGCGVAGIGIMPGETGLLDLGCFVSTLRRAIEKHGKGNDTREA
ncbi:MAG: thiamine phosphate synthase [Candidatus Latescibacterota bacterium]